MRHGLSQPVAAVVLSKEAAKSMSRNEVSSSLDGTIITVNHRLEAHERIDRIVISNEAGSIDNGLLTPTLKIKRNELEKKYKDELENTRKNKEKVVWL